MFTVSRHHFSVVSPLCVLLAVAAFAQMDVDPLAARLAGQLGPSGEPVSEAEIARLLSGTPLVALSKVEGFQVKRAQAVVVLPYPARTVYEVVSGVEDFPSFMPYVADVIMLEPEGERRRARFKLDFPWPVGNREYNILLEDTERETDLGTALVSAWRFEPGSGNIAASEGEWEITPLDDTHCFIRYMTFTDPGGYVPAWLQNASMDSAVPKVIQQIRKTVEARLAEEKQP